MGKKLINQKKKIINMGKGIAVNTILLMLVGIIVVGIIIYIVYTYTQSSVLSCTDCRAKFIQFCMSCKLANGNKAYSEWTSEGWGMTNDLSECADKCRLHNKIEGINCKSTNMGWHCYSVGIG